MKRFGFGLVVLGALSSLGCEGGTTARGPAAPSEWTALLRWGSAPDQAGLRPAGPESPADGVAAVAPGPGGGALLLDRLNRRVLARTAKHAAIVAEVPADAEDLAAGENGVFLLHSALRARALLFDGAKAVGELAVDRNLRALVGLSLGPSRRVFAHGARQETIPLGSPHAPQTLAASLHGKRKGAFLLSDGSGVSVRVTEEGRAELLLVDNAGSVGPSGPSSSGRARIASRYVLPERVLAARVVGVAGEVACLRLEQRVDVKSAALTVERKAVCHDLRTGKRLLERPLGEPGLYLPRRELAVGTDPPRLLFIRPEAEGLRLSSWRIP